MRNLEREGGAMDQLLKQGEVSEASPEKGRGASRRRESLSPQSDSTPKVVRLNRKSSLVGAQIADEDEELFLRRQSSLSSMFSEKMMRRASPGKPHSSVSEQPSNVESPGSRNHSGVLPSHSTTSNVDSPGSRNHSGVLPSHSTTSNADSPGSRNHSGVLPSHSTTSNVDSPGSRNHSGVLPSHSTTSNADSPGSRNHSGVLPSHSTTSNADSPGSRNHSGVLPSHSTTSNADSPGSRNQTGSPGKRIPNESHSGVLWHTDCDHTGHTMLPVNVGRLPSGHLYPCSNPGANPNSSLLNVAHFTFDNNSSSSSSSNLTERLFKKLMGQSRLHRSNSKGGDESPVSTLDCPKSPTEQRSFRGKSKRKSLRSRVEDANTVVAANPRPKSQLAQYLRSITATTTTDDDDVLEGPSEVAWLEPDSPYHSERSYASTPKKKSPLESWSSSSSTWNLQNPLRIVSRRQNHTPKRGRVRTASRFGESKGDAITRISLTGSYDGSYSARSRVKKGSELSSGRSWWSEIGSGRKSSASIWTCSGRLHMDDVDSAEPDLAQTNNAADDAVKTTQVNEAAFPFNKPVASSFVFQEEKDSQSSTPVHDIYHDPVEEGSGMSDSETSASEPQQWDSALIRKHSFDYVREVAVGSGSGALSSRALSRLLLIERAGMHEIHLGDGRFSVDLQRGQKLDKASLPPPRSTPHIFASEKSSKRSILSPCLPFLQRSPHNSNNHNNKREMIQQAVMAPSSRRLQAMSSFTARLGRETPSLAGPIYVQ